MTCISNNVQTYLLDWQCCSSTCNKRTLMCKSFMDCTICIWTLAKLFLNAKSHRWQISQLILILSGEYKCIINQGFIPMLINAMNPQSVPLCLCSFGVASLVIGFQYTLAKLRRRKLLQAFLLIWHNLPFSFLPASSMYAWNLITFSLKHFHLP